LIEGGLVTDLTSIGTLFAFVLVSGGVLLLPRLPKEPGKFRLPYINGKYIIPVITGVFIVLVYDRIIEAFQNVRTEGLQEILFLIFVVLAVVMAALSYVKNFSFIPVMGVLTCSYLMIE